MRTSRRRSICRTRHGPSGLVFRRFVKFVVDANLPPALARWLASQGHEAHHVSDFGLEGAPDPTIWQRARDMEACIVTKDEDFVLLQALDRAGPAIVWISSAMRCEECCCGGFPRFGLW